MTTEPHPPLDDVTTEKRPWGAFESLVMNTRVSVKIITLEPGARVSLQRHQHRSEIWQILDIPMVVTVDDKEWTARLGDRVYIPEKAVHRIANPGSGQARFLEVCFGTFKEDDIERLDDDYDR